MTLLVIGASGLLGGEVCRRALAAGERVAGTYHSAELSGRSTTGGLGGVEAYPLDLRDRSAVTALVARLRPRAVVNAAYRYDDWAVTAVGAGHVAAAAAEAGARLVHVSSDALHGGRPEPYLDDEPPSPVFAYGAAKAAAETAVRLVDPRAALVRTSLIVGDERSKQVRLCLDALAGRAALLSDEVRCPVGVDDLAAVVLELVDHDHAGPLNAGGPDPLSRVELGLLVARRYGLAPVALRTTTVAELGGGRPVEIRLDSSLAGRVLHTRLRGMRELLAG